MKITEKINSKWESSKETRKKVFYFVRQTIGLSVLSAGTVAYLVEHLNTILGFSTIGVAVALVGLVLYFSNKR
jgi:hypothetical protein